MKKRNHTKGSMVFLYCMMILILLTLLVTATYTWFSISRTPRVSNIGLYINAPTGLVLSTDPEADEWVRQLDFAEMAKETSPLRPVTWSEKDQRFYAAVYGPDGRQTGQWLPLSDEINANRDDVYGYYIKATLYATTDTAVSVSLTHAREVEEGVSGSGTFVMGTPQWDAQNICHFDGGYGAQTALRVGMRITPMKDGQELTDQATFLIYEPNSDTHMNGTTGYLDTPSIDGTDSLVPADRLIRQTASSWTESDPVEHGKVIHSLGQFEKEPKLFNLGVQEIVRMDLYIWLEGQDVDCDNRIGRDAQISANVQFYADPDGQSGLKPLPDTGKEKN